MANETALKYFRMAEECLKTPVNSNERLLAMAKVQALATLAIAAETLNIHPQEGP